MNRQISGEPAYEYRGFHLDVARHFFPLSEIKKMMRQAAEFGMNYFHLHVSDDQGYRLPSRKFPRLNEVASWRKGDHFGTCSLDVCEGGFYSEEEIREMVGYAQQLGIEIIPEIDMPGHFTAILAAYPQLSCRQTETDVALKGGVYPDILCAGRDEAVDFAKELLREVCGLFPGRYIHIGGDEAPKKRWEDCPFCRERMRREGLRDENQLQGWLTNVLADEIRTLGKRAIVWQEAARGGNLNPEIVVQLWTTDGREDVVQHLKNGGHVIMSEVGNSYCDYPVGLVPLRAVYNYDLAPEYIPENCRSGVLGREVLLWTEYVRDNRSLERLAWPRFAAAGVSAWHGTRRIEYTMFERLLREDFGEFAECGIEALPPSAWDPSGEEAQRQMEEFGANFSQEQLRQYHTWQIRKECKE